MTDVLIGERGELEIPDAIRRRYHLEPDTPVRIIETKGAVLIVPLTGDYENSELARELAEWQQLGIDSWAMFPYEGSDTDAE